MKDLSFLENNFIAHRGLHDDTTKENTMEAFQRAIDNNYIIELDTHITSDNVIVVFHDDDLSRIYNINKNIKDCTYEELSNFSNNEIPTLKEVLDLINDKVPVIIEIKKDMDSFILEENLVKLLDTYNGKFTIKSFSKESILWFKNNRNNYIRGYLINNNIKTIFDRIKLRYIIKKLNPDYISVHYKLLNKNYLKFYKGLVLAWTIKTKEKYNIYKDKCNNLICENIEKIKE